MVAQPNPITKPLAPILSGQFSFRSFQLWTASVLTVLLTLAVPGSAHAWIKPDPPHSVNAALVYGMKNQRLSLSNLLGDNWIEGGNGSLLNVYSPFMMLATKAAKAGLSSNPSKSDLEEARKRFARDVKYYSDTQNRFLVKFSVAFYGDTPDFAKTYYAKISGVGRGKVATLKPEKQNLDQIADPVDNGPSGAHYEAINAYYFLLSDLMNLDEFKLQLESPTGQPVEFSMKSERLY